MVPVSIRTGEETEKWSNRVSAIFADLPTTIDDPIQRVEDVHHSMAAAKEQHDLMPASTIADLSDLAPPALAVRAARLAARTRLADRTNPPANLVLSNVPGPRSPLQLAEAELLHYYPVSTVIDGQGLNITVQSYVDTLDFGLVSCRELVPDLWDLAALLVDELYELADAAGLDLAPVD
jgi:WS/DGAT/MGAT family acyltransferase